ncbi:DUF2218 domain-containing protein [Phyllobacterium phragmitis]|uniref:DUF2218 domain-containing protein n=1 Tax=Phyllobacterium phragmitis TaxID=2670329 RepID=A0A2S9IRQ4_9HYPH|nr:DUF2218 domain-containing protein [Phyllobacterium phragmitis]PRD43189.1 DUF2218 domain-containing protein [Phyllobacterium phragmitis]
MKAAPYVAAADVPTSNGSKYLQQLYKHGSHSLTATFTAQHGAIVFPKDARGSTFPGDGLAILDARAGELIARIEATTPEQRDHLKGVVARHLDRQPIYLKSLKWGSHN